MSGKLARTLRRRTGSNWGLGSEDVKRLQGDTVKGKVKKDDVIDAEFEDAATGQKKGMKPGVKGAIGGAGALGLVGAGAAMMDEGPKPELTKKEQALISDDKKALQQFYGDAKKAKDPKGLDSLMSRLDTIGSGIDPKLKDQFEKEREGLAESINEAKKLYSDKKKRSEMAELIETLAHAFTQFGAGLYGMKHGVDMSGLKFDKTDWDSRYNRARQEYKDALSEVKERRGLLEGQERRAESESRRKADFIKDLLVRDFFTTRREQQREINEVLKKEADRGKAIEKLQKQKDKHLSDYNEIKAMALQLEDASSKERKKLLGKIEQKWAKMPGHNVENFRKTIKTAEESGFLGFGKDYSGIQKVIDKKIQQTNKNYNNVGAKEEPASEDQQAIKWARANPKDPRAVKILKMHGLE